MSDHESSKQNEGGTGKICGVIYAGKLIWCKSFNPKSHTCTEEAWIKYSKCKRWS